MLKSSLLTFSTTWSCASICSRMFQRSWLCFFSPGARWWVHDWRNCWYRATGSDLRTFLVCGCSEGLKITAFSSIGKWSNCKKCLKTITCTNNVWKSENEKMILSQVILLMLWIHEENIFDVPYQMQALGHQEKVGMVAV